MLDGIKIDHTAHIVLYMRYRPADLLIKQLDRCKASWVEMQLVMCTYVVRSIDS
jgi:hypothetical protein